MLRTPLRNASRASFHPPLPALSVLTAILLLPLTAVASHATPLPNTKLPDSHHPGSTTGSAHGSIAGSAPGPDGSNLRVATYNASLNRSTEGELVRDLSTPDNAQAQAIATIIQNEDPDILLINEFDYDEAGESLDLFRENYLEQPQRPELAGVHYPHAFSAPVNTGVDSGLDLDNNGELHEPNDAWGFGDFPGQYGMAVFSKHPLATDDVRTFQNLLWSDMPGNLLPTDYYGDNADKLRLSSKSHWDLPVDVGGRRIHLLVSHPTPPSFDGPEKRNGRRNSDEIRLTSDYITGGRNADWIVDDQGRRGGIDRDAEFIVLGDQNSDPQDGGAGLPGINQLLDAPRVQDPLPASDGGREAASDEGNSEHLNPPENDTADFADPEPGNLRADYVLPSEGLTVDDSGIAWPASGEPYNELMDPETTSDHRLVWADLR